MGSSALLLGAAFSVGLTLMLKVIPVTFLKDSSFPALLRRWLDFVPVAVMAALVGPDIFFYGNHFNFSFSNLFLLVSVPTFLVAWVTHNYFVTIAVGLGLIILARYFGFQ